MPRMSKQRRLEWSFFLNHRNRITYNVCRGCLPGLYPSLQAEFSGSCGAVPALLFKAEKTAEGAPMTDKKRSTFTTNRRPDCVTEIRMGNSVCVVSGFFKENSTATAADKMMKVLKAEGNPPQKQEGIA